MQGQPLKLRRPKDYQGHDPAPPSLFGAQGPAMVPTQMPGMFPPGMLPGMVPGVNPLQAQSSPHKLYIGNLPKELTAPLLEEMLTAFGPLKSFSFPTDASNVTQGFAFCEYEDSSLTDAVIESFNGFEVGDTKLIVRRAAQATAPVAAPGMLPPMSGMAATRVLVLLNMVTEEDLKDDEEYDDLVEDITGGIEMCGKLKEIKIPRPSKDGSDVPGVGKIFAKFENVEQAKQAQFQLGSKSFDGRRVVTSYMDEDKFDNNEF
jgi:splicing factor U2AF subunit